MKNSDQNNPKKKSNSVRRKFTGLDKLQPNQPLDKLSKIRPALTSEISPALFGNVGDGKLGSLLLPGSSGLLFGGHVERTNKRIHAGITRVKSGSPQEKSNNPGKILARPGGCRVYTGTVMADLSANQGGTPKPKKQRKAQHGTELTINPELAALAKEHFETTRYKSLTGFVNKALLREMRKRASEIKAKGLKVPDWLFLK